MIEDNRELGACTLNGVAPVHNVRDCGAVGDWVAGAMGRGTGTNDFGPIEQAFACAAVTGGTVLFPPGKYYIDGNATRLPPGTGSYGRLVIRNNVSVEFMPGAELIPERLANLNDWPTVRIEPGAQLSAHTHAQIFNLAHEGIRERKRRSGAPNPLILVQLKTVFANWFSAGHGESDGSPTDIGARFNNCIWSSQGSTHIRVVGEHSLETSMNATDDVTDKTVACIYDFRGSKLKLRPSSSSDGYPVLDLTGNRFVRVEGLLTKWVEGLRNKFGTGILLGRGGGSGAKSAGQNKIIDCTVVGEFHVAALYNHQAETCTYQRCRFYQHTPGGTSAVVTRYNMALYPALEPVRTSPFAAPFHTNHTNHGLGFSDTKNPMNNQSFVACEFWNKSNGTINSGLHIHHVNDVTVRGCYFKVAGKAGVFVDQRVYVPFQEEGEEKLGTGAIQGLNLEDVYAEPPGHGSGNYVEYSVYVAGTHGSGTGELNNSKISIVSTKERVEPHTHVGDPPAPHPHIQWSFLAESGQFNGLELRTCNRVKFDRGGYVHGGQIVNGLPNKEVNLSGLDFYDGTVSLGLNATFTPAANMGNSAVSHPDGSVEHYGQQTFAVADGSVMLASATSSGVEPPDPTRDGMVLWASPEGYLFAKISEGGVTKRRRIFPPPGGPTANVPHDPIMFETYMDTTHRRIIWFDGTDWLDSMGNPV